MAPFLVLVILAILIRGVSHSWETSTKFALAGMFIFTGATHFSDMKHDYAAMVPEILPSGLWTIYITGALELAGAIGLLIPRLRRAAGVCLILLLVGVFPANVNAALQQIPFRGEAPTALWLRAPIQLVFAAAVWWTSVRPSR